MAFKTIFVGKCLLRPSWMRRVETKEEKYVSYYLLTILASKRGDGQTQGGE